MKNVNKFTLDDKWSWRRAGMLLVIVISTVGMTTAVAFMKKTDWNTLILLSLSGLLFCVLLALNMEWNRMDKGILDEKANNYVRIAVTYVICSTIAALSTLLPDYTRPVMVLAVMMAMAATPFIGMMSGMFFSLLLCVTGSGSIYLMSCYLLLCICGCMVTEYMQKDENRLWCIWMTLSFTFCMISLFSCLAEGRITKLYFIYGLLGGLSSGILVFLLYRFWYERIKSKKKHILEHVIKEDYELVQAMKSYSKADYAHAMKVSAIARECAGTIAANPHVAAVGGFYYRLGRLEGEPYVENGVMVAVSHDFPPEIVKILQEYNGEKSLPSTIESALIHIVDNVVTKFDVFDKEALSSSWNQDIVVYQTLNENSALGLYDKAGLSMNMFLKIRDYLLEEADLY